MSATAFQRLRREQEAKRIADQETANELDGFTVAELKASCDEKGIKYDLRSKKADLIKLLEGAE
ncbi:MAG: hypothetical protein AB7E31_14780 [Desulfitobacterium sp.]